MARQSILFTPITDKYSIVIEDDKVRVGASSMQGWRNTMEDAHTVALSLPGCEIVSAEDMALFVICDGHSGSLAAQTVATNISTWLCHTSAFKKGNFMTALVDTFKVGDSVLREMLGSDTSGCTCLAVLIAGGFLYCASVGDSRAVLCRDNSPIPLSHDHKPTTAIERRRIEAGGGFVSRGRVNGVLALSRALGDYAFKNRKGDPSKNIISAMPDIQRVRLTPQDEFFVLACDGVWDVMDNSEVVTFVRGEINEHSDMALASENLMDHCLATIPRAIGTDNMTVIIVHLKSLFVSNLSSLSDDSSPS